MALGTLDQLHSYNVRSQMPASGIRAAAASQGAILRRAVRGSQPAAPAPEPHRITIRELNQQLSLLPLGPRDRSRFALRRKNGGAVDFFELRRIGPGRYLLLQLLGAPGRFASKTMSVQLQHFAALHIAEDLAGAAKLFGDSVGCCGRCGSPLTNEESRAIGLGPTCREHYGV